MARNIEMKILILEPFYTNFHIDLASYLSNNIDIFIFNFGSILYLNDAKKIFIQKNILNYEYLENDLKLSKNIKTLYTETLRKIDNQEPSEDNFIYMARYIAFTRKYLLNNKIELVMMHNDLRWQHALAIEICKELNIKYLVTERGIFRPNTTTVDFKGVNGYSNLPKGKEFYKNSDIKVKKLKNYKVSKTLNLKINIRFSFFILLNKIGNIFNLNSNIKNKSYSLSYYINLLIKQKFSKSNNIKIKLPKKYIFIPLQVNTDTQILIHSDFKNMQEFISKVENDFYSLDSNLELVFKIHPMEQGIVDYTFDERSIVIQSDTNELIQNSEFLITINSTVGFEAIQQKKKVMVLGKAFFKIEDISVCSSKESFKQDLQNLLLNDIILDGEAIDKFVEYLKYEYQVNGNLFNYNNNTFEEIKLKLENGE